MADCMECDYDIDEDCEECPYCGLENPVSYRWFNDIYKEDIEKAKKDTDYDKLADLYLSAYIDAGMLPDPYVMGDMARELEQVYLELEYHERLIWLYVEDATHPEWSAITDGARKAYLHATKIERMDLELYVMDVFDYINAKRYQKSTPEDLVDRKQEILTHLKEGKIKHVEYPMINVNMWKDFDSKKEELGFLV